MQEKFIDKKFSQKNVGAIEKNIKFFNDFSIEKVQFKIFINFH